MIDIESASHLLDFSTRIGPGPRADEQLHGAVAIHNILEKHGVAYLADEVGMGKTYVALGALALFRHFDPFPRRHHRAAREHPEQVDEGAWELRPPQRQVSGPPGDRDRPAARRGRWSPARTSSSSSARPCSTRNATSSSD